MSKPPKLPTTGGSFDANPKSGALKKARKEAETEEPATQSGTGKGKGE